MATAAMPVNAFINKPQPTDADLATALGPAKVVWDRFLGELAQESGVTVHEWKSYSPKSGWALSAKRKSRTIVWLAPAEGGFTVAFILGDRAVQAARQSKLPKQIMSALDAAPKYPEGTGLRLRVASTRTLGALKTLAAIKLAN